MKNIHVLPTDKPSRLYKSKITQDVFISDNRSQHGDATYNVNIYITSDEEIKFDEYYLGDDDNIYCLVSSVNRNGKKIILTTDQELIKDNVQKIDDKFLEWFVQNPSCEEVEVVKDLFQVNQNNPVLKGSTALAEGYKIIIPKEELKQETLEEAASRLLYNKYPYHPPQDSGYWKDMFKEGAKWQQERMYSEEDLLNAFEAGMMFIGEDKGSFREWFEQFKKHKGGE